MSRLLVKVVEERVRPNGMGEGYANGKSITAFASRFIGRFVTRRLCGDNAYRQ